MEFLKKLFAKRTLRLTNYEQPVIFVKSNLPGFLDLIRTGEGSGFYHPDSPLHWINVVDEAEIPLGEEYFKYMGNGKFTKHIKHELRVRKGTSPVFSQDMDDRVLDFSHSVGNFSDVYTRENLWKICFDQREKLLTGFWK